MQIIERLRNSRFLNSLRTQLILYYMIICFIVMAVGSYFIYTSILYILKNNNEKYLLQQFRQDDHNLRNVFSEVDGLSRLFLQDDSIQQFLQENYNTTQFEFVELENSIFNRIDTFISNYSYINSIYLFTGNNGGIGGNEKHSIVIRDFSGGKAFFSSKLNRDSQAAFPKIVMDGGINEGFFNPYLSKSGTYLISAARGVKPIYQPNKSATLLFNIDESYIASIYSGSDNPKDWRMYVVDGGGMVISGSGGRGIGRYYASFSSIDRSQEYGSFTLNSGTGPIECVYYRMEDPDWYIIGEIPVKFFTGDIAILQRIMVFVFVASFLIILAVSYFWARRITGPLSAIATRMQEVSRGNLGITLKEIPKNEFGIVARRFNEMSLGIVELIRKNDQIQEEKRALEIETLQYQINPHFLYNALNMVKWMAALINARNIVDSIISIGNILKPVFKNTGTMCTVGEEVNYLENYIRIINCRFNNGVRFSCDIDSRCLDYKIPRFILQPIVENSVTHGMKNDTGTIDVILGMKEFEDRLELLVEDTGTGIDQKRLEELNGCLSEESISVRQNNGDSIGLYNVNRRIKLNFGGEYGLSIENAGEKGARVRISVPRIL